MSDPRSTLPAEFRGRDGTAAQIIAPVVDLMRAPDGSRDRQVLFGAAVTRYSDHDGWSLIQCRKDGYVGYVPSTALGPSAIATHWVKALATHVYHCSSLKTPDLYTLSFGSKITVTGEVGEFAVSEDGNIPRTHLTAIATKLDDPIAVAKLFIGTPYLWGGNSRLGIDCSGLVQASLLACGIACPGDSDQQELNLGKSVAPDSKPERGDLIFWRGHVAMVVDPDTIIHANAGSMSVSLEPLAQAIERIEAQGDGKITAHKRLV